MARTLSRRYDDPLDVIWVSTAARCGLRVVRSDEVYAAYDGDGTLTLSTPDAYDPDDSLAQLVLHELCHALVEGEAALALPDWGLDNRSLRDLPAEHACHRLQAALADTAGLRGLLAPTTDHRPYYDALPADPLADDPGAVPEVLAAARRGWTRATAGPWAPALTEALGATAAIARVTGPFGRGASLWVHPDRAVDPDSDPGADPTATPPPGP